MEYLNFNFDYKIPKLDKQNKQLHFEKAKLSERQRSPLIIHKKGDEFNQVFNFILEDSYMKPHMHPGPYMIEKMHLIFGSFKLIFFNKKGIPTKIYYIDKKNSRVEVPARTWHTYVMTSKSTIVFETMVGKYDPKTWKIMSSWAPDESSHNASEYLQFLKNIKI